MIQKKVFIKLVEALWWQKRGQLTFLLFFLIMFSGRAGDTLTVTFTGDVLLDRGVRTRIQYVGIDRLFSAGIRKTFQSSDIVVGNLECPATKIKSPVFKKYIFRAEPEWLFDLQRHGFTHLNLANNHSIDQGRAALLDTKNNIEAAGMIPVGAGNNMPEAAQPILLATYPRPVYLLASLRLPLENYAYLPDKACVSQEPIDTLCARINRIRQQEPSAYIIVNLHWGWEHQLIPTPTQRQTARQLIDAGANCLIGHHTHTLQTVEEYKGCRIYYSIGNFIFDQTKPINTRACIVKLKISRLAATVETIPIEIKNCTPHIVAETKENHFQPLQK